MEVPAPTPSNLFDDYVNEEVANIAGTELIQQETAEKGHFVVEFERICSVPAANQPSSIKEKPKKKKVNVTVTVVSVAGIHIQDRSKPKKGFMSMKTTSNNREMGSPQTTPPMTITASFSRKEGQMKNNGTPHVASLPVQLSDASPSSPVIIHWPEQDEVSSSYHFQQEWLQEEEEGDNTNANSSVTKPCTVHLAITKSGRMFNLGRAEIVGDKVGESFIDIPIIDEIPSAGGKQTRFVKGNRVKMMKLKGVGLKCGLGTTATLRAKVQVSEPFYDDPETTQSFLLPPSRMSSPLRVGSIKKSSSSTSYHSQSTNTTSKMSSESSEWGVEIQFNTVQPTTTHTNESLQTAASMSEASMDSYSSASDMISSLGEDNSFFEYDKRLSWRHFFTCNFPVCGVMKQECADIQQIRSQSKDTFDEDEEPSRSSSYVPW
eukprot:scaffold22001_cov151-Skeletonema_dohrnii-CCMP3373.AAC.3